MQNVTEYYGAAGNFIAAAYVPAVLLMSWLFFHSRRTLKIAERTLQRLQGR